jgi:type I restriction enzyme S subunit
MPFLAVAKERKVKNKGMIENNLLSLSYGNIISKDINTTFGLLPESFETYQLIFKGDIVFRLTDLQNDKKSLRSAICKEDGIITSAYLAVKNTDNIHSDYFNYLMRAYDVMKVFYAMGGGMRQSLKCDDMKRLPVVFPNDLKEQKIIADFTDRQTGFIDEMIEKKSRFIELLKEKRQVLVTHAVTKGMNPDVKMKDSGVEWLGEVPEHWDIKPFWACYSRIKKTGFPKETLLSVYRDFGVVTKDSRDDNHNVSSEDLTPYQLVEPGQLVTNKMKTWQGSIAVSGLKGIVSPAYFVFTPKFKHYALYMHHLFRSMPYITGYISSSKGVRVGQWDLEVEQLRLFPVLCPPMKEQQTIAEYIGSETTLIDSLISKTEESINLLKEKRSALITAAVTGKIDVREEA